MLTANANQLVRIDFVLKMCYAVDKILLSKVSFNLLCICSIRRCAMSSGSRLRQPGEVPGRKMRRRLSDNPVRSQRAM